MVISSSSSKRLCSWIFCSCKYIQFLKTAKILAYQVASSTDSWVGYLQSGELSLQPYRRKASHWSKRTHEKQNERLVHFALCDISLPSFLILYCFTRQLKHHLVFGVHVQTMRARSCVCRCGHIYIYQWWRINSIRCKNMESYNKNKKVHIKFLVINEQNLLT